jgi:hypothetical protein
MVTLRGRLSGKGSSQSSNTPGTSVKGTGNTPAHIYLDTPDIKKHCKKELERIKKHCAPETQKKPSMAEKLIGAKATAKINAIKEKISKGDNAPQWLLDHCDSLWIKPISPKKSSEINELGDMLKSMTPDKIMAEVRARLDVAVQVLEAAMVDAAQAAAMRSAAKKAGTWGVGALFGPIGLTIATVFNAVDTAISAAQLAKKLGELRKELTGLRDGIKELPDKLEKIIKEAAQNPQKAVADTMSIISRLNDCVRARRCQLVPMKETYGETQLKAIRDEDDEENIWELSGPASGKGCCPGQTGHHILPKAIFKECKAYQDKQHRGAPTICVEGVNNSHASHGQMHSQLDKQLKQRYQKGATISYNHAIKEGIESVRNVFPESGCSKECLKVQLEKFYNDFKDCSLEANSGKVGKQECADKGGNNG